MVPSFPSFFQKIKLSVITLNINTITVVNTDRVSSLTPELNNFKQVHFQRQKLSFQTWPHIFFIFFRDHLLFLTGNSFIKHLKSINMSKYSTFFSLLNEQISVYIHIVVISDQNSFIFFKLTVENIFKYNKDINKQGNKKNKKYNFQRSAMY